MREFGSHHDVCRAEHLFRALVITQAEEHRLAQLSVRRPLLKGDLGDEPRCQNTTPFSRGGFTSAEREVTNGWELLMQCGECPTIEAGSDLPT